MITHPDYDAEQVNWEKWRLTSKGGREFVDYFLRKFSKREDDFDFINRREMSYCPAFAKAAVNDIRNSIYQRMVDITRVGGPSNFQSSVKGNDGGIDLKGSSMNSFIGQKVLPELLTMRKVGVFIDKPPLQGPTIADNFGLKPYIYMYHTEDIMNWVEDINGDYDAVLLRDTVFTYDDDSGFPTDVRERFRKVWRDGNEVFVEILDENGEVEQQPVSLGINKIPFVVFEISHSLLEDIADYQIALLNMVSSDVAYILRSNFPFYTEQFDPAAETSRYLRSISDNNDDDEKQDNEVKLGVASGRRYPLGSDRPGFIHPSSEPIKVSMDKQEQLKSEIRLLLNLAITNLKPMRASAESKETDDRSLESGLSSIGQTLEIGERQIARIWAQYENSNEIATINYPNNYSLRSEDDRRSEVRELFDLMEKLPSKAYQKSVAKQAIRVMLEQRVSKDDIEDIDNEIDDAPNLTSDPDVISQDVERGLVSAELASQLRGYPDGEIEKAKVEHTERLIRIAEAQGRTDDANAAARGVDDLDPNIDSGKDEKRDSRNTDIDDTVSDKTRGDGK